MIFKFKNFLKENVGIIFPLFFFLLLTLIIQPFGEHAVNDDWQFYTHVRYFLEGNFVKNSVIDASFILQGLIAFGWVKIFGLSFLSLRILTILFTVLFIFGFYKVLKFYKLKNTTIVLAFLSLFIEPLFINSTFSFMTEIYFLTFSIWSFYFLLKGLENQKKINVYLILALILGSLTLLIRQFGVVLFIAYIFHVFQNIKNTKQKYFYISLTIILFLTTIYLNYIFPQHKGDFDSKNDKFLKLIASPEDLLEKLSYYPKYLVYMAFYLAPFVLSVKKIYSSKLRIKLLISLALAVPIFTIDIFDLKNVFHIECLHCETQFKHSTSIFDNIYFKFFLSYILGFVIFQSALKIYENKTWEKINLKNFKTINPELLIALGMFGITYLVDSFYERYFINFAVFFIIYISRVLDPQLSINYVSLLVSSLFLIINVFLNIDFYKSVELRWKQAYKINKITDFKGQIFTIGSFYRFLTAQELSPKNYKSSTYFGTHKCFVTRHISGEDHLIVKLLNNTKSPLVGYIENPTFSNTGLQINLPKNSSNFNNLIDYEEYFSPMYNLLGRKTYIISFCDSKTNSKYDIQFKNPKDLEIK